MTVPVTGSIYALDLGTRLGFAEGRPGAVPRSGAVVLKEPGEHRGIAMGNLIAFLNDEWSRSPPALVVKEAALPLAAFARLKNSDARVRMDFGLHGVVDGMAARFGAATYDEYPATIRKHFIGKGNAGKREATKIAVVSRCIMLGLLPAGSDDDDQADALAFHDWACATFGQPSTSKARLHLFDEKPAGRKHG